MDWYRAWEMGTKKDGRVYSFLSSFWVVYGMCMVWEIPERARKTDCSYTVALMSIRNEE